MSSGDAGCDIHCTAVDSGDDQGIVVGIDIVGQDVAGNERVLGRAVEVVIGGRRNICHDPTESLYGGAAMRIGCRDRHRVRATSRCIGVERSRDQAGVEIEAQARRQVRSAERQRVAGVRVTEVATNVQVHDFAVGVTRIRNYCRDGSVIGPSDSDGQRCGGSAAFAVGVRVCHGGRSCFT